MDAYLLDTVSMLLRWAHIITGIAWIGASFYFVSLDNSLTPPKDKEDVEKGVGGEQWGVHGGGFYHHQKYPISSGYVPDQLHWSMWESYSTWLTGFALFTVMYLFNASTFLIDKSLFDWSPAAAITGGQANLVRGTRLLRVNGIDLVNANSQSEIDQLNAGLFPATAGVSTTFVVRDPGATSDRTITMTSISLSPSPVNRTRIINTPTGKVGYILFNTFSPFESERAIVQAITELRINSVTDLVLDLRYNGGGLLAVSSQLAYMIAGANRTAGKSFSKLRFNQGAGSLNPVTGGANNPTPFYSQTLGFTLTSGTDLPALNLSRVFILSTAETCSASEAVINGLRGIDLEVNLIGSKTCGKPYGFYPQDNCGETYYTIQFQTTNDKSFGDYADGFLPNNSSTQFGVRMPGCEVADDLTRELGDPNEALLAAALQFRVNGTCPVQPSGEASSKMIRQNVSGLPLELPARSLMETNYDMTMPSSRTGTR